MCLVYNISIDKKSMLNYAEFSIKKIIENKHLGTVGTW